MLSEMSTVVLLVSFLISLFQIPQLSKTSNLYSSNRVVSDYQEATVTTTLKTSTADLSLATFPKIVICNKYQLRYAFAFVAGLERSFHNKRSQLLIHPAIFIDLVCSLQKEVRMDWKIGD